MSTANPLARESTHRRAKGSQHSVHSRNLSAFSRNLSGQDSRERISVENSLADFSELNQLPELSIAGLIEGEDKEAEEPWKVGL